jgi:hypothetical protein
VIWMVKRGHDSHSNSHSDSHGHSNSHSDSHGHSNSHGNNDCPCFPADCDCDVAVITINPGTGRVSEFDTAPDNLVNCITVGTTPAADAFRCLCQAGFRFAFSLGAGNNERLVFIRCDLPLAFKFFI